MNVNLINKPVIGEGKIHEIHEEDRSSSEFLERKSQKIIHTKNSPCQGDGR